MSKELPNLSNHELLPVDIQHLRVVWILSGVNKQDMAARVGLNPFTLREWMLAKVKPKGLTHEQAQAICDNFGCSLEYLTGASDCYGKHGEDEREMVAASNCSPLRYLRLKKGLAQWQLAVQNGTHQSAIYRWENGKERIPNHMAIRLAEYFGVSVAYLREGVV